MRIILIIKYLIKLKIKILNLIKINYPLLKKDYKYIQNHIKTKK
jgi:hypothetical protein